MAYHGQIEGVVILFDTEVSGASIALPVDRTAPPQFTGLGREGSDLYLETPNGDRWRLPIDESDRSVDVVFDLGVVVVKEVAIADGAVVRPEYPVTIIASPGLRP